MVAAAAEYAWVGRYGGAVIADACDEMVAPVVEGMVQIMQAGDYGAVVAAADEVSQNV